ncbi:RNA-binding protein pno1 [Trichonephila clavata]|uniref:RNA-binding protein pno1 n=1 Tax=Trichonephila clavata TaxID=2740835 RepID=A0A8X6K6E4_TRICU|nr:RNA-binding protein pno1 [Trichonephila clavata]
MTLPQPTTSDQPTTSEEPNKSDETWSVQKSRKRKRVGMEVDPGVKRPYFPPAKKTAMDGSVDRRKIPIPRHRYTPLKANWLKIYTVVVEHLNLQIRFNTKAKMVELRTCEETKNINAIQKAADFIRAFALGFEVDDAMALVRLDELYLESFDIKDVKTLRGDHLSRAIGRIVGKNGITRYTIENGTKTRIICADSKIHIMGSYQNIRAARRTISNLIMGTPPSKVFGNMKKIANRLAESI